MINMKNVGVAEAKANLSELIDSVRREGKPVMIRKRETPVAVLVEPEEYRRLQDMDDRVRRMELARALKGKRFRLEEALSELGIAG